MVGLALALVLIAIPLVVYVDDLYADADGLTPLQHNPLNRSGSNAFANNATVTRSVQHQRSRVQCYVI